MLLQEIGKKRQRKPKPAVPSASELEAVKPTIRKDQLDSTDSRRLYTAVMENPRTDEQASTIDAWTRTELARHPQRPHPMDFITALFTDYAEIHGDRKFADDPAISCGMAKFHGQPVMVIGSVKGRATKERIHHKFGMPDPEGYRKALRAMKLAEKFGRSVLLILDIPGAWPGTGAEERGQGEAIARNILEMSRLRVPAVAVITGEGMSGGVLGLAVADRLLMLENSILSIISPEGCAAITWKDGARRREAAAALKYTAEDVLELGIVDEIIPEPEGGMQNDPASALASVDERLQFHLREVQALSSEKLLEARYQKFRNIAQFYSAEVPSRQNYRLRGRA